MLTEADIVEALRVRYDPELQINVVDLGTLYAVHMEPDPEAPGLETRIRITIDLLPRDEASDAMLAALVANRLYGLREVSKVEIRMLNSPRWTHDRMTPAGRRERSRQSGLIQLG